MGQSTRPHLKTSGLDGNNCRQSPEVRPGHDGAVVVGLVHAFQQTDNQLQTIVGCVVKVDAAVAAADTRVEGQARHGGQLEQRVGDKSSLDDINSAVVFIDREGLPAWAL